jgi:hypothetical protein
VILLSLSIFYFLFLYNYYQNWCYTSDGDEKCSEFCVRFFNKYYESFFFTIIVYFFILKG